MASPLFKKWKIIWAPHDISPKQKNILLDALDDKKSIIFLSDANLEVQNNRILVLDTIGMLKYAYRYAKLVYVGGGFGKGIHNLLEPMVYHLPVVFGPNHLAFPEARYLVENGGGFCINNLKDWDAVLEKLNIPAFRDNCGIIASSYIAGNMGTMDKILPYLYTVLDKNEQG
jgi:3-deoxy-D-manno-octulosonic-acid transferase